MEHPPSTCWPCCFTPSPGWDFRAAFTLLAPSPQMCGVGAGVFPSCMRGEATGEQCIPLSWAAPLLCEPCKAISADNSDPRQQSQGKHHVSNLTNSTSQAERPDLQSSPLGHWAEPSSTWHCPASSHLRARIKLFLSTAPGSDLQNPDMPRIFIEDSGVISC